jgi:hypothetical protein
MAVVMIIVDDGAPATAESVLDRVERIVREVKAPTAPAPVPPAEDTKVRPFRTIAEQHWLQGR